MTEVITWGGRGKVCPRCGAKSLKCYGIQPVDVYIDRGGKRHKRYTAYMCTRCGGRPVMDRMHKKWGGKIGDFGEPGEPKKECKYGCRYCRRTFYRKWFMWLKERHPDKYCEYQAGRMKYRASLQREP